MDSNPWRALGAIQYINSVTSDLSSYTKLTIEGAIKAVEMQRIKSLPSEESAIRLTIESRATAVSPNDNERVHLSNIPSLIVSLRVAFSELMVSLIDGAPSEIAVATLRNMNAIANWDVHRATDSTVYVTISSVQVDNMVPNAPFPVAVCPFDLGGSDVPGNEAPVLVIGLSFAPKHKSKILVRMKGCRIVYLISVPNGLLCFLSTVSHVGHNCTQKP